VAPRAGLPGVGGHSTLLRPTEPRAVSCGNARPESAGIPPPAVRAAVLPKRRPHLPDSHSARNGRRNPRAAGGGPVPSGCSAGVPDEWHLLLGDAFRHLASNLGAGPGQPVVVIPPPLLQPRLVTVRAVPDPVGGDGGEQVAVQPRAFGGADRAKLK